MKIADFRSFSCADAAVALGRIGSFLTAEELAEPYAIDKDCKHAIEVEGDFQWETVLKSAVGGKFSHQQGKKAGSKGKGGEKEKKKKAKKGKGGEVLPTVAPQNEEKEKEGKEAEGKPFELKDLNLKIPKGAFVAIVGRVGSGKVSTRDSTRSITTHPPLHQELLATSSYR